jgi:hypothetical protein
LQADIVQFFPSMDHAILRGLLARRIADRPTMDLIDHILASGAGIHTDSYETQWLTGDDLLAANRSRGLPIGNQTSQFWANLYLDPLDRFIKHELRCRAYLRYCDDLLLFAADKPTLHRWRREIEGFLETLRLKIHAHKTAIYPVSNGIPFLGFLVFPDHRRLKQGNGHRFARRLRWLVARYQAGDIDFEQLTRSVQGWVAHAAHGDTWGLRRSLFSQVSL